MKFLVDTNVLIYSFQKENPLYKKAFDFLYTSDEILYLSCLSSFELLQGVVKEERPYLEEYLDTFQILPVSDQICRYAGKLMVDLKIKAPRRKIDMLLAATAMFYNLSLVTANVKDFKNINDLEIKPL